METTPLPAVMPVLPPGRFYRVRRESVFSFPTYWVEIREQGRWFSRGITEAPVKLGDGTTPEAAIVDAACRAWDCMDEFDIKRGKWRAIDRYVGDHKPEGLK